MNTFAYTITKDAITLVLDGGTHTIPRTSPQAGNLLKALHEVPVDLERVAELVKLEYTMQTYTDGQCTIMPDGTVTRNGVALPKVLADKVIECYEDGVPYANLLAFFDRLEANPSKRAVEELYTFLEHKGMPVTPEGRFLAYKGIREDGFSITGGDNAKVIKGVTNDEGRIRNLVGDEIEVIRNYVEDNRDVGCASGLHAGSLSYASGFGPKVVIVSIDPADVVSIPKDCECQKLRTCAYKVVAEAQGIMRDTAVRNENCPYADADTDWSDDDDDDYEISIGELEEQIEDERVNLLIAQAELEARKHAAKDRLDGRGPVCSARLRERYEEFVAELDDEDNDAAGLFAAFFDAYAEAMK